MTTAIIYDSSTRLSNKTPANIRCSVKSFTRSDTYRLALTDCGKTATLTGGCRTKRQKQLASKRVDKFIKELVKFKEYCNTQ